MYSALTCSFNNICKHFNLAENPLKDHFKNILWKMDVTKNSKFGLDWNGPLKVLNRPIRALYLYKNLQTTSQSNQSELSVNSN